MRLSIEKLIFFPGRLSPVVSRKSQVSMPVMATRASDEVASAWGKAMWFTASARDDVEGNRIWQCFKPPDKPHLKLHCVPEEDRAEHAGAKHLE
jgi:alkylhydroperoxidase family enzyme